jgi:3-dehydrosphinganine reductase
MKRRKDWSGRHVLITGGSSGIGLAIARDLAGRGARISVVSRDQAKLDAVSGDPALSGRVAVHSADVRDDQALAAAVTALQQHGPVTDLVTSAGWVRPGYFEELDPDLFRYQMDVNYFGTLNAIRLVLPGMLQRGEGSITCISSAAALIGIFGYTGYTASKFAVRGLCESLRMELRPRGIHVAAVFPADVDTPQLAEEEPYKPRELKALSGKVSPASADSVARVVIRGIDRQQAIIVPGWSSRMACTLYRWMPRAMCVYGDRVVAKNLRPAPDVPAAPTGAQFGA